MSAKNVLVVESPAKCKTLGKILGPDFTILASYGHIRDLVPKENSIDVDHDFAMHYELIERNIPQVNRICHAVKQADNLYLASDLDREGEAISWHLREILEKKGLLKGKNVYRIAFAEITPNAVKEAVAHPRDISMPLVNAQQARRALDFLVGFNLSPVLWRKVQKGLSAGRVQSPALRMIVERDEAIEAFTPQEYWTIAANLTHPTRNFTAKLTHFAGTKTEQFTFPDEASALKAKAALEKAAGAHLTVGEVTSREKSRRPAAPFTTSTLQQEAARKLGFSTSRTMKTAQGLYEGVSVHGTQVGLITYMRTDSTALSEDALGEIRGMIVERYGKENLPASPKVYTKKSKNAQEAHEAIRPSSAKRHPKAMKSALSDDQYKLYSLIWKRTIACQMMDAKIGTVAVDFPLPKAEGGEANFRANGSTVIFPGFLSVYEEGKDDAKDEGDGNRLPHLRKHDRVPLEGVEAGQHFTEPPPRFTEASIVKTMEEYGIGRPSTYASIIQVLLNRKYVELDGKRFKATDIGRAVGNFLTQHFSQYVDYDFTAHLEDDLDAVSRGEREWIPLLKDFWDPFHALVEDKKVTVDRQSAQGGRVLGNDPTTGEKIGARIGKFGPVVYRGDPENRETKIVFASLMPHQSLSTITLDEALALLQYPRHLGVNEAGEEVVANHGKFGPYVKAAKTYASLEDGDDLATIELPRAMTLINARREQEANRVVQDFGGKLRILRGAYGIYCSNGSKNVTIPKDKDPTTMTKEEVEALIKDAPEKKWKKGGRFKKGGSKKGAGPVDDLPT